jgi:hypothetical protein
MLINGKYLENITCPRCRWRHPAELSCTGAAAHADAARCKDAEIDAQFAAPFPGLPGVELFVVKHYSGDERPTLKGNGFDGLEIGESREEAEEFVAWLNERLAKAA